MPEMKKSDFGKKVPANSTEIMQFINNIILHHEESIFWDDDPNGAEQWESNLITRYLSGDRSGNLHGAPDPIWK